ncbi:thioredoxin [Halococcus thailandensis JCM 13552]|uniref:Thioredoxin n=1 Tax=Halococcus thailandensis JCM 13552 TaxID=1227457 RepID=M0NHD9_9EURY|nr:thioredoxin [Halococcus thailandensis JCM 13552]
MAALGGLGLTGGSIVAMESGFLSGQESDFTETVETIDARGSEAGEITLPRPNTPTVIDLFATWCAPCRKQMTVLSGLVPEYTNRLTFISVTNERFGGTLTKEDVRAWWRKNDGDWTLGHDPESDLMSALNAEGLPYLAITDASGTIQWTHSGVIAASMLRTRLDTLLDGT